MNTIYQEIADLFDGQYCPDFSITQGRLQSNSRRGVKGGAYVQKICDRLGVDEEMVERRGEVLKAFMQRGRQFQTFVPGLCLRTFFREFISGNPPFSVYKGVSYNPKLIERGERIDNLDFFSWMRGVQNALPEFVPFILDASPYQVINEMGELRYPDGLDEDDFAEWFYEQILEGLNRNPILRENCRLRGQYLEALRTVSGVRGLVVSIEELMRDRTPELCTAFKDAKRICQVSASTEGLIDVKRFVDYRRYDTSFARTYTPAVIAEALYFSRVNGIQAKLGPTSELAFDNLISEAMRQEGEPYNFFWYSRPFERSSTPENRIYTTDSEDEIVRKANLPGYSKWLDDISSNMGIEGPLPARLIEIRDRIMEGIC